MSKRSSSKPRRKQNKPRARRPPRPPAKPRGGPFIMTTKTAQGDACGCPICDAYGIDLSEMAVGETRIIQLSGDVPIEFYTQNGMWN